jgi:hypothetical protein
MFAKVTTKIGALIVALGLVFSLSSPAHAATQRTVYFVSTLGSGLGVYSVNFDPNNSNVTPEAVTPDTATGHIYRSLATDDTRLYFADNNQGSTWDLVSTDLTGGDHQIIAAGIATPEYIKVWSDQVFFTTWRGGLFSVPKTGGTPQELIGPTHDAGLGGSAPTSGYGPFAFVGSHVFVDVNAVGIIKADWLWLNPSGAQIVSPAGYSSFNITDWYEKGSYLSPTLYVSGYNISGFKKTTDLTTDSSGWDSVSTSFPGMAAANAYRTTGDGEYVFFTSGSGDITYMSATENTFGLVLGTRFNSANYGIAVVDTEVNNQAGGHLANTGGNLNLIYVGLTLIAIGIFTKRFRMN